MSAVASTRTYPLYDAAFMAHGDVVELFLERGAEADTRDVFQRTPLIGAVIRATYRESRGRSAWRHPAGLNPNYPEPSYAEVSTVIRMLAAAGADVNARTSGGWAPLDNAAEYNRPQYAELLRGYGGVCFAHSGALCGPQTVASCSAVDRVLSSSGSLCVSECPDGEVNVGGECSAAVTATTVCASGTLSSDGMSRWRLAKELRKAVKANDLNLACTMLRRGANVNDGNEQSNTPLHFAADRGYLEMAAFLLANGADADDRGKWSQTPLHFAAKRHYLTLVTLLIGRGADVNALKDKPQGADKTPLDLVQRLDPEVVSDAEAVASALRDADGVCFARTGSLCGTATAGRCAAAGAVLAGSVCASGCSAGYELDSDGVCVAAVTGTTVCESGTLSANGMTQSQLDAAMLSEARDNDLAGVCEYLRRGANVEAREVSRFYRRTGLMIAATDGNLELAKLLRTNGADVNLQGGNNNGLDHGAGWSALLYAAAAGHADVAGWLLDEGADIETPGDWSRNALSEASLWGRAEVVRLLLARGASPDVRSVSGWTPLHETVIYAVLGAELEPFEDPPRPGRDFRTAVVSMLVDGGVDVNARINPHPLHFHSFRGHSVLDAAAKENNAEYAAILRGLGGVCFVETGALCGTSVASCSAAGLVLAGSVCASACPDGEINVGGECFAPSVASCSAAGLVLATRSVCEYGCDLGGPVPGVFFPRSVCVSECGTGKLMSGGNVFRGRWFCFGAGAGDGFGGKRRGGAGGRGCCGAGGDCGVYRDAGSGAVCFGLARGLRRRGGSRNGRD